MTNPNHPDFFKIKEFLARQPKVSSYEIIASKKDAQKLEVNIQGSLVLQPSDLKNGRLFFKIRKLTGDIYIQGSENMTRASINKSVIPTYFTGDIVFIRSTDIKEQEDGNLSNTEFLSENPMSQSKVQRKLEEVLTEIVNNKYPIGINEITGIIDKLGKEWSEKNNYKLTVKIDPAGKGGNNGVRFYINDCLLNLTAIEKAVYILFILEERGRELIVNKKFKDELKQIYSQISDRVQDDENGIMGGNFSEVTLNSCRSQIRAAIKEHISNARIVDDFAIEGYKGQPFMVAKATDAIRQEIKKYFVL